MRCLAGGLGQRKFANLNGMVDAYKGGCWMIKVTSEMEWDGRYYWSISFIG